MEDFSPLGFLASFVIGYCTATEIHSLMYAFRSPPELARRILMKIRNVTLVSNHKGQCLVLTKVVTLTLKQRGFH